MDTQSLLAQVKRRPLPPKLPLTLEQQKKDQILLASTLINQPFFAHLLMSELSVHYTDGVEVAATDGKRIFRNPNELLARPLGEQVFIDCHEILHVIWLHCQLGEKYQQDGVITMSNGDKIPYDAKLANIAEDYIINACLTEAGVGVRPADALYDVNIAADGTESMPDVYKKVYDRATKNPPPGKRPGRPCDDGDPGEGGLSNDVLAPAEECDAESIEQQKERIQVAVAAAVTAAKVTGNMPASLERIVSEILEPKVSWQEVIKSVLQRKLGSDGYDWRRADRRLVVRDIFFASPSSFQTGHVVVAVDTSGSIGQHELNVFFAEMAGIIEDLNPSGVTIMFCDAEVNRVDEVEEIEDLHAVRQKGPVGGGGTSFKPVFDKIAELNLEPEALVYLTDGYGDFPDAAPGFTVVWGMTSEVKPPFGEVVSVEL